MLAPLLLTAAALAKMLKEKADFVRAYYEAIMDENDEDEDEDVYYKPVPVDRKIRGTWFKSD